MAVTYTDTADLRRDVHPSPGALHRLPDEPSLWAAGPRFQPRRSPVHVHYVPARAVERPSTLPPSICLVLAARNLPPHRRQRYGGVSSAVAVMAPGTKLPPCDPEAINISFREPYLPCYGARLARGGIPKPHPAYSVSETRPGSVPQAKMPLREGHLYTRFTTKVPPDHGRSRPSPRFQHLAVSTCPTILASAVHLGSRPYKSACSR